MKHFTLYSLRNSRQSLTRHLWCCHRQGKFSSLWMRLKTKTRFRWFTLLQIKNFEPTKKYLLAGAHHKIWYIMHILVPAIVSIRTAVTLTLNGVISREIPFWPFLLRGEFEPLNSRRLPDWATTVVSKIRQRFRLPHGEYGYGLFGSSNMGTT